MGGEKITKNLQHWLYRLLRVALGILFIWAGWNKLLDPAEFARIIANYQILPLELIHPVAILLPWTELICGLLLVIGVMTKGSTLIIDLLLLIFICALGASLYRGLDVSCGCFTLSSDSERISYFNLLRETAVLGVGVWLFAYQLRRDRVKEDAPHAQL